MLNKLYNTRKKYRRGGRPGEDELLSTADPFETTTTRGPQGTYTPYEQPMPIEPAGYIDPQYSAYMRTQLGQQDRFIGTPFEQVPSRPEGMIPTMRAGQIPAGAGVADRQSAVGGVNPADLLKGLTKGAGKLDWNKVKADKFVPFISNIVNSLRRPPMPGQPVPAGTVSLRGPNMDAAREQVRQQTYLANRATDVLPANAAAAVRAGNFGTSLSQLSQISSQEAAGAADATNRTQLANQQILAGNNAQRTEYQNQLAERTMAMQRQQSENLAGAADKYMGIQEQERQRQADITKLGILSKAYSYGNVNQRWLQKMQEEGLVPPGWDTEKKKAYGGPLNLQGGGHTTGGGEDPPSSSRPLAPEEVADWNAYVDYLDSVKMKGSPELDKRDKHLAEQYFNEYRTKTPGPLKFGDVGRVQTEMVKAQRYNIDFARRSGATPEQIAAMEAQLSPVDNWAGSVTTGFKFPSQQQQLKDASGQVIGSVAQGLIDRKGFKPTTAIPAGVTPYQSGDKWYYQDPTTGDEVQVKREGGPLSTLYREGGKIHIKPENKGKFTAFAKKKGMGVQEAARHVLANKGNYSSTVVKRANFARNASKWKHGEGGELPKAEPQIKGPIGFMNSYYASPEFKNRFMADHNQEQYDQTIQYFQSGARQYKPRVTDNMTGSRAFRPFEPKPYGLNVILSPKQAKELGTNLTRAILPHEYTHTTRRMDPADERKMMSKWQSEGYRMVGNRLLQTYDKDIRSGKYYNLSDALDTRGDLHDAQPDEQYADLNAVRYLMFEQGIYDTRKGSMTKDDWEKAKSNKFLQQQLPFQRLLKWYGDKVPELNNEVAAVSKKPGAFTARYGGRLNLKKLLC